MKMAEEWANEVGETVMQDCFARARIAAPGEPTIKLIQKIQLDALQAGMTEAMGECLVYEHVMDNFPARPRTPHEIQQAILIARINKKL